MAYCKRFITNCRKQGKNKSTCLTAAELRDSLYALAKLAQRESFSAEMQTLTKKGSITKGRLASLNAFIDQNGFLRVGGRLKHSEFEEDKRYPIVLSADRKFTKLVFINEHLR